SWPRAGPRWAARIRAARSCGPSSRARAPPSEPAFHVGDMLLARRPGQDRDELPAVPSPLVEDLLGGVGEQRDRDVLEPGCGSGLTHAPTLGNPGAARSVGSGA